MRISDWSSDVCSSDLRNNGNARFDQIVPVLDTLGIAVANEKYDCRCIGPAVFRQALLPALVQRVGLRGNLIDVVSQGQGDNVGIKSVNNCPGLPARTAVPHVDPPDRKSVV